MLKVAIIDSGIDWDILKNNEVIDSKSFLYKNKKIEINDNVIDESYHGTFCYQVINEEHIPIEYIIIKILNKKNEGHSLGLIQALRYLYKKKIDIINLSLATVSDKYLLELNHICEKLKEKGVIIISSLSNSMKLSYPARLPSVIGVVGNILKHSNEYWYSPNKKIQIVSDCMPVLVKNKNGLYTFFGWNSKASAKFTNILINLINSNNKYESVIDIIEKNSKKSFWETSEFDYTIKIDKIYHPIEEDIVFKELKDIVIDVLKITNSENGKLLTHSLFNPTWGMTKEKAGEIFNNIEIKFNLDFSKKEVRMNRVESLSTLYNFIIGELV